MDKVSISNWLTELLAFDSILSKGKWLFPAKNRRTSTKNKKLTPKMYLATHSFKITWHDTDVPSLPPLYPSFGKLAQIDRIEARIRHCNNCSLVSSQFPKHRCQAWREPKLERSEIRAVRRMFHDLNSVLCENCSSYWKYADVCYHGGGCISSSILLLFQWCTWTKFSKHHNKLGVGTDSLFLSLISGWDNMSINDSTFVKKKKKKWRESLCRQI